MLSTFYMDETATNDMFTYLIRKPYAGGPYDDMVASYVSSSSGYDYLEVTSIANPEIDLQSYSYWVEIHLPPDQ